jgi:hypothetical protein
MAGMTKRRQAAVVHALLALVAIVALALATTWALLAIGEGTAAINLREYGAEFTFGGTFALFIGLMGIFVKTFKNLMIWLTVVLLTVLLSTNFQTMSGKEAQHNDLIIIGHRVLFMALVFCGLVIVVWVVLRPWRWNDQTPNR